MTETTPQPDDYLHLDLAEPDEVALESDTEIDTAPVSETAIEPQMQSDILESGDAQTSAAGQVTLLTDSLDDPNHSDEHVFLDFVHDPLSHPAQDPVDPSTDTIGDDDPNTDTRLSIDIDPQDPLQDIVIQRPFVHLLGNQSTPLGTLGWSPSSPQQVYGSLMDMELNRTSSSSSLPSTTTEALSLASATPASMARTTAISTSPVSASPLVFEPTSTTSVTDGVASSNYITPDLIFQPSGIYVDERSDSEESGAGAGSSTSSGRPTKPVHPSILRPLTPEEVMVPIAVRRSNRARQPSSLAVQSSEYLLHSQGLYGSAAAVPAAAAPAPAPVPVERVTRSKKVYCYCQKPDDGNVMIQCDNCRQWFHGACVDITDETAEMMELKNEKFFCEPCDERVQAWRAIGSSGGGSSFTVYSDTHDCDLPTCLNEARPTSDYCSEECAIKGIELQATEAVMNKENIPPVVYIPSPKQASSSSSGAPSPSTQQTAPESPKVEQDPIRVTALKGLTESLMVVLEPKAAHDEPQGENNEPADKDSGSNAGVGCDAAVPGGSDTAVDAEHVGQLAAAIEKELYSFTASPGFAVCGKDYKAKYRSLFFNLKDKNNVNLRSRVVSGELEPHDLVRLSHEELANPELQNIAKEIRMRSIHDSVLTVEEEPYIKKTHKGEMSFVPRLSSVGGPSAVPYLDHADSDNGSSSSGVNGSGSDEHTSDNNGSSMDGIHNTSSNYNNNSSDTDGISNQSSSSNDRAFGSAIGAEEALNGKQDDENAHHSSQSTPTGSAATDVLDKLLARIQTNKRSGEEAAGDALAGDKRQRRMDLALDGNEFESLHSADSYLPREPSPYSPSPPGSPVVHSTTPRDSPPPFLLEDLQQAAGIDRKRQRSQRVLSTAWQGTVFMHQVAKFSAKAVQVGGRTLVGRQGKGTTGLAWSDVLAKDILVDGRIPIVAVETYVGQQRQSSTKEVVVVKFEVQGSSSDSSDHHHAEFDKLFEYFHTKQRNGVVPQKNRHVKDMYLVPLAAKGSLPEYLRGLVEDDVSVSGGVPRNTLLGVLVLNKEPSHSHSSHHSSRRPHPPSPSQSKSRSNPSQHRQPSPVTSRPYPPTHGLHHGKGSAPVESSPDHSNRLTGPVQPGMPTPSNGVAHPLPVSTYLPLSATAPTQSAAGPKTAAMAPKKIPSLQELQGLVNQLFPSTSSAPTLATTGPGHASTSGPTAAAAAVSAQLSGANVSSLMASLPAGLAQFRQLQQQQQPGHYQPPTTASHELLYAIPPVPRAFPPGMPAPPPPGFPPLPPYLMAQFGQSLVPPMHPMPPPPLPPMPPIPTNPQQPQQHQQHFATSYHGAGLLSAHTPPTPHPLPASSSVLYTRNRYQPQDPR